MNMTKSGLMQCVLLSMTCVWTSAAAAKNVGSVASPDGKNVVEISVDDYGTASYRVLKNGKELVSLSKLGLNTADVNFTEGLDFKTVQACTVDETYSVPSGKFSEQRNNCNESRFTFEKNGAAFDIVVRSYNDGVAYRYELSGYGNADVLSEQSEVQVNGFVTCWGERYVADYSTQYPARDWAATAAIDNHKMCAPVLVKTEAGDDAWLLITESAVNGDYHASALFSGNADQKVYLPSVTLTR